MSWEKIRRCKEYVGGLIVLSDNETFSIGHIDEIKPIAQQKSITIKTKGMKSMPKNKNVWSDVESDKIAIHAPTTEISYVGISLYFGNQKVWGVIFHKTLHRDVDRFYILRIAKDIHNLINVGLNQ